jgi:hypothetical protein
LAAAVGIGSNGKSSARSSSAMQHMAIAAATAVRHRSFGQHDTRNRDSDWFMMSDRKITVVTIVGAVTMMRRIT